MKPTPFYTHPPHERLRYGRPGNSKHKKRTCQGGCSGALSTVSFREFRCTINAPKYSEDENLAAPGIGVLGKRREDEEWTPSLTDEKEGDDDDDIISFENLSDCMRSMTSLETNKMVKSFNLYMRQHHQKDCDFNTSNRNLSFASSGHTIHTPEAPWSLNKWLLCRFTSASVGGIQLKNGFEPDLNTLDGIRKELLFGDEKW